MAGAGAARSTGAVGSARDAAEILGDVKGIAMTRFGAADVVRHPLVARIVEAYEAASSRSEPAAPVDRVAPAPATFQEGRRSNRGGRS